MVQCICDSASARAAGGVCPRWRARPFDQVGRWVFQLCGDHPDFCASLLHFADGCVLSLLLFWNQGLTAGTSNGSPAIITVWRKRHIVLVSPLAAVTTLLPQLWKHQLQR